MKIKFWLFAVLFAAAGVTSCSDDPDPTPTPPIPPVPEVDEARVNQTVNEYMSSHYLWNAEYKTLTPDFSLSYTDFLSAGLTGVQAQKNANKEDGYIKNKKHYWYSYITREATKATKAGDTRFGFGLAGVVPGNINGNLYIGILGVIAGSPASKAEMDRGLYITEIDGTAITQANYETMYNKLFPKSSSTVQLKVASVIPDANNKLIVTSKGTKTLKSASYSYNPIVAATVAGIKSKPEVKIGYIAYNQFLMDYDKTLIETFKSMRDAAGAPLTDLILDLRYNQGGHLLSSTVLATLIAGSEYKGQVYCEAKFNAERNAKEKARLYKIGIAESGEVSNPSTGSMVYPYIEQALTASLDLKCIYVLTGEYTASASELIINGLRGLGIEVRLIGEQTIGKNVGMEGVGIKGGNGYNYEFYPITMRLVNKTGFGEYYGGFAPDVLVEGSDSYLIGSYGSAVDQLFGYAMKWIKDGVKPTTTESSNTRASQIAVGEPRIIEPLYKGAITCVREF